MYLFAIFIYKIFRNINVHVEKLYLHAQTKSRKTNSDRKSYVRLNVYAIYSSLTIFNISFQQVFGKTEESERNLTINFVNYLSLWMLCKAYIVLRMYILIVRYFRHKYFVKHCYTII